jgi:PAS domain S-box-containing protein
MFAMGSGRRAATARGPLLRGQRLEAWRFHRRQEGRIRVLKIIDAHTGLPGAVRGTRQAGGSCMNGGSAESKDPLHLGVDAAEIGTWNWHIGSGRVDWTPWTYQLFGFQPGGILTSHDLFLRRVHAPDRPAVLEWLSRAIKECTRTVLEFRIKRADGTLRWVRSTGRVLVDERGLAVRMAGVVEDVTDRHGADAAVPAASRPRAGAMWGSFSARQVARILGVAEVTVKRMAASGEIRMLRSSQKNSRRFAAEHVLAWLGNIVDVDADFESIVANADMSSCVAYVLDRMNRGTSLEALLDDGRLSTTQVAPIAFIDELLSRMPFMFPERHRGSAPALLVEVGSTQRDSALIRCVLHARGYDVLRAAGSPDSLQLAEVAHRVRARFVIVLIGSGLKELHASALSRCASIAAQLGPGAVLVQYEGKHAVPAGVTRFRSMRDLGSLLR